MKETGNTAPSTGSFVRSSKPRLSWAIRPAASGCPVRTRWCVFRQPILSRLGTPPSRPSSCDQPSSDGLRRTSRIRYLLADEVKLGKTIEAGLIMRELKLYGRVARTLVIPPKGLVTQWVAEMQTHFGMLPLLLIRLDGNRE